MIDIKLKKQLEKKRASRRDQFFWDESFWKDLIYKTLHQQNTVIHVPSNSEKRDMVVDLINQARKRSVVWYVAQPETLTEFQILQMKFIMNQKNISLLTHHEMILNDGNVTIWTLDIFYNHLSDKLLDFEIQNKPDLIIFDDVGCINDPEFGTDLEIILLSIPEEIPSLFISTHTGKESAAFGKWLERTRKRSTEIVHPDYPDTEPVAAMLDSNWNWLPLLDKKRISGKAKKQLKEGKALLLEKKGLFKTLMNTLRDDDMVPAIVFLPPGKRINDALEQCPVIQKNAGAALTNQNISAVLEQYPFLKGDPKINDILGKRVAPFFEDDPSGMRILIQYMVSLGYIDAVFTELSENVTISGKFRTALFFLPDPAQKSSLPMHLPNMEKLMRMMGQGNMDTHGCCIALAHTKNVDAVRFKDHITIAGKQIKSAFRCDPLSALHIILKGSDPESFFRKTFSAFLKPDFAVYCMKINQEEFSKEIPDANCYGTIGVVYDLIDFRLKLMKQINVEHNKIEDLRNRTERDHSIRKASFLEHRLSLMPCNACEHLSFCHKRGSKKFRGILEGYAGIREKLRHNISGLLSDFYLITDILKEFKLIERDLTLTDAGRFALHIGLPFPFLLLESISERIISVKELDSFSPIISGFLKPIKPGRPESLTQLIDEDIPFFQIMDQMDRVTSDTWKRLLHFGKPAQELSEWNIVALSMLNKQPDIEETAKKLDVRPGKIFSFIKQTNYLKYRIRSFRMN